MLFHYAVAMRIIRYTLISALVFGLAAVAVVLRTVAF